MPQEDNDPSIDTAGIHEAGINLCPNGKEHDTLPTAGRQASTEPRPKGTQAAEGPKAACRPSARQQEPEILNFTHGPLTKSRPRGRLVTAAVLLGGRSDQTAAVTLTVLR